MNFRNNFSRLAEEYIRVGKNDKAKEVLDRCVEVMPKESIEYNYFMMAIAESYYKLKEYEKGNDIVRVLVNNYEEELRFYTTIKGEKRKSLKSEIDRDKYILQQLILMTNERYKESGLAKEMEKRFVEINNLILTSGI
jgi:tetratricopeptide (TPR) repeat protein